MRHSLHLVDLLHTATVSAPTGAHVELQEMDVGGDRRLAIFQHPDSSVRFALPRGTRGGKMSLACGIKTLAWERLAAPVRFRVGVDDGNSMRWLWERTLDPRHVARDRTWASAEVALPAAAALILETTAAPSDNAWAGWADPVLDLELPAAPPRPRPRPLPHVLLITADALRADFVMGDRAHTPQLDALGADGLRFEHARAASAATPASYASLLTGTTPVRHGLLGEWGTLPAHLPNLATELARSGWQTIFAPSEREIATPAQGFAPAFDEALPCLGNPCQDGSVTTRHVLRRLERASDEPLFVWVQLFDSHPPRPMREELVGLYYDGDPRDPRSSWQPERVAAIHGVESLAHIESTLPHLRAGRIDASLLCRLRDTARRLAGEIESGPDLAEHVAALGPPARRGTSSAEFAGWLGERVAALESGRVDPDLVAWLESMLPRLRAIQREVLLWLDGVVDYRYPLAQVAASATHVDAQVGALLGHLRAAGLYECTTVVFCSPHGELFGEGGEHFHHHALLEAVLRIPLILKPAGAAEIAPGEVRGAFDAIDLLPTVVELLGLAPPRCDGSSRLADIRAGRPIPRHDSLAVGVDGVQACLAQPPHKLLWTGGERAGPAGSWTAPGTKAWLDVEAGKEEPCAPPPAAAELERRLDAWIAPLGARVGL